MQIYWIDKQQRCGPASVPDVLAKVQLGELSPDTQGWHRGCEGWRPLRELPALVDFLGTEQELTEPDTPQAADDSPAQEDEPQPEPAVIRLVLPRVIHRLLARVIDTALYATVAMGIMYLLRVPYNPYFQPGSPIFWLPMLAVEAYMLHRWHTTPGKRWLGIRLQSIRQPFTYGAALLRSMLVFVLGMGCMNLLLGLIMLAFSYVRVTRRGATLWDMRTATLPILTSPPTALRIVGILVFLLLAMNMCSLFMQPWLPDMINELQEQSPDAARVLRDWLSAQGQMP